MAKRRWGLISVLPLVASVLGIVLALLPFFGIWYPFWSFLGYDWFSTTLQVLICGLIILVFYVLGWKMYVEEGPLRGRGTRSSFVTFIVVGILLLFLFGNLAGILFLLDGLLLPFGS